MIANTPSQSKENSRILFRSYVSRKTQLGEIYQHLLENTIWDARTGKDMAALALTAFYLPYARQGLPNDKATAQFTIEVLLRQIAKIQADFEIDQPAVVPPSVETDDPDSLEQVARIKSTPSKKTVPDAFYGSFDLFES